MRLDKIIATAGRVAKPVLIVAAVLYLLIDALVLPLVRWIVRPLARLPVYERIAAWLAVQSPYVALALLLVPLVILEPVKPVGLYLIATRRVTAGLAVLLLGELIKLVLVERLYHICLPKLLLIPAFAWGYRTVTRWLMLIRETRAVRVAMRAIDRVRAVMREVRHAIKPETS